MQDINVEMFISFKAHSNYNNLFAKYAEKVIAL